MWPGNDASAGKRRSGKTPKGNKWLRRTLTQAAWAATKRKGGYLSAQYRQLSARRGKKRAIVALGHTILIAAYHMLKDEGMSKDWVRHEVAAIIVVRRIIGDTTRCPISGILRRCAGRQRPVQSLRTMYPQS